MMHKCIDVGNDLRKDHTLSSDNSNQTFPEH